MYEYGTGACSGAPYNTSALFSTVLFEPERLAPQKTLLQWLKDLKQDGLILTSFIFGLISGEHVHPLYVLCNTCILSRHEKVALRRDAKLVCCRP